MAREIVIRQARFFTVGEGKKKESRVCGRIKKSTYISTMVAGESTENSNKILVGSEHHNMPAVTLAY